MQVKTPRKPQYKNQSTNKGSTCHSTHGSRGNNTLMSPSGWCRIKSFPCIPCFIQAWAPPNPTKSFYIKPTKHLKLLQKFPLANFFPFKFPLISTVSLENPNILQQLSITDFCCCCCCCCCFVLVLKQQGKLQASFHHLGNTLTPRSVVLFYETGN